MKFKNPNCLVSLILALVGFVCLSSSPINLPAQSVQAANESRRTNLPAFGTRINGKIAFVASQGNDAQIETMNPDGSDRSQITSGQGDFDPAWSPDGTQIAFVRTYRLCQRGEIFVMNADGSNQRRLTQSQVDRHPTWSPDGRQIAFVRNSQCADGGALLVMNADGSDQRDILDGWSSRPAWSPDGSKLAVENNGRILLISLDGSNPLAIPEGLGSGEYATSPAWSPDGAKIAFIRSADCDINDCYSVGIWTVNAHGSNPTKLADVYSENLNWSPDGTKITFNNGSDLLVMNSDGSGITNITNTLNNKEFGPSWQPVPLPPLEIDDAQYFVRQHYRDFLNREPDTEGLAFWTQEITSCETDQQCIDFKRINVSAAFFLSIEFQETGYLAYRMYKASYGDLPDGPVPLKLNDFLADTQEIGSGVIVNQNGWQQTLENNKQNFAQEFVERSRFTSRYPASLTCEQFVDQLYANAGFVPSPTERAEAINEFGSSNSPDDPAARSRALRRVAESEILAQQEFNKAFVLMQYFGYLRRNPNDPPEATLDYAGYNFWLNKLNQFSGNFVQAEMVKAFITSTEYRQRFGQP